MTGDNSDKFTNVKFTNVTNYMETQVDSEKALIV